MKKLKKKIKKRKNDKFRVNLFPYFFYIIHYLIRKINFWDQYAANTQHLDDLLAKNDTTIEELLDDDNIIQELKNLNPRLLNL